MAPSGRTANDTSRTKTTASTTRRTTTRRRTRQPRRTTHFKKKQQQQQQHNTRSKKQETSTTTVLPSSCSSIISSQDSSKEEGDMEISEVIDVSNSNSNSACCSTPKGQKFRIPEISTCPPAPKKPRVLSNYSLRRSPLSFFAPPDLELFFFVALRDVSV